MPATTRCRFRRLRAAMWTACALIGTACASPEITGLPKVDSETTCITPAAQQDTVVGVALSGGSSQDPRGQQLLHDESGLDAAILRSNAILRQFGVIHGAAGQGEI
jgi:hypothetical protein